MAKRGAKSARELEINEWPAQEDQAGRGNGLDFTVDQ